MTRRLATPVTALVLALGLLAPSLRAQVAAPPAPAAQSDLPAVPTAAAMAVTPDPCPDPAEQVELSESLTFGFLVVLDRLGPVERAVFLLADVFGEPYSEIARTVGKSDDACRQIASRACRRSSSRARQSSIPTEMRTRPSVTMLIISR